jgi:hypothetical protein
MNKLTALLTTGGMVLSTVLGSTAAFAQAASASPSRTPVVYEQGWNTGHVRPHVIGIGEGGSPGVIRLSWSHWTGSSARASGKLDMLRNPSCTPTATCRYIKRPVVVRLSRVRQHGSNPYYSRMSWSFSAHGRHHVARGHMNRRGWWRGFRSAHNGRMA